jgi:hypothetical protein
VRVMGLRALRYSLSLNRCGAMVCLPAMGGRRALSVAFLSRLHAGRHFIAGTSCAKLAPSRV